LTTSVRGSLSGTIKAVKRGGQSVFLHVAVALLTSRRRPSSLPAWTIIR
jgi:hypothetical protein